MEFVSNTKKLTLKIIDGVPYGREVNNFSYGNEYEAKTDTEKHMKMQLKDMHNYINKLLPKYFFSKHLYKSYDPTSGFNLKQGYCCVWSNRTLDYGIIIKENSNFEAEVVNGMIVHVFGLCR